MSTTRDDSGTMSAAEYRFVICGLGLTQGAAARLLGVSIRTSHSYANGGPTPKACAEVLRDKLGCRVTWAVKPHSTVLGSGTNKPLSNKPRAAGPRNEGD
jgi:hypothetical protein